MSEVPPPPLPVGPAPLPTTDTGQPTPIAQQSKSKNTALRIVGGIALGMVLSTALLASGAYWLITEPERLERKATEALQRRAALEAVLAETPNPPRAIQLSGKKWARQIVRVVDTDWEINPSESRAYPYVGKIRISLHRWATVFHPTREEAEADDVFYVARDEMFYEKPEGYSPTNPFSLLQTIELAYDRRSGWQTRKKTPP